MSLVREKVKLLFVSEWTTKIIDAFNVVDMMIEVSNMNDAVRMAQRLTEKVIRFIVPPVPVLICLRTMKIGESNKQCMICRHNK
jgi:hypothetical protein